MSNTDSTRPMPQRHPLRRGLRAAALVAGGIVIGAGGVAAAAGEMGPRMGMMGWHHHHHGFGMLKRRVRGALDNVGATTAQEDKVHDIIAGAASELDKEKSENGGDRRAMRKRLVELMKAPTLDRDAFEKLRAQKVSEMEAKSKVISNALFDAASQLSPEQRAKLADEFEARMERGRGDRDGERGDGMDGRGERGPDHGMDHGPDRPDHG